ncbi:MAG: hypothetical protein IJS56_04340 [Bacilli bacterium]|nr:hypothetical protein [Bacilli bacterium]
MSESRSSESRSGYSSSYSSESRSSGESRWGYTPSYSYESRNSNESRMSFAQSYSSKKSNNNVNKSSEKTVIDIKNKEQYNVLEEIDELIEKYNNDDLKEKSQNEKINSLRSDRRHKLEELKALRNSLEKALKDEAVIEKLQEENDALDEAIKSITRKMK